MAGPATGTVEELRTPADEHAARSRQRVSDSARGWWNSRRCSALRVALLLILALTSGFAVMQTRSWLEHRAAAQDRRDAVAVAEKVTVALSDINFKTADTDIASIVDLTTGALRATILKNAKTQSAISRQYRVRSVAKVDEAGVVKQSDTSALVAVAVSSRVWSSQGREAQPHWFRVTVLVEKEPDGRWAASNVEFVQ